MSEKKPNPEDAAADQSAAPEGIDAPAADADAPEGDPPIPSATRDAPAPGADADPAARIAELETLVAEANDRALRALAEAENVRRRAERDKQDASKYAVAAFARDVLTVGDNLRRALDAIDADARKASDAMETLATGVEMTERELISALERQGIKPVDPLGQRFDSNQHEALFEVPDENQPSGTVAQVIEVGYMLHDRLLRPAKVGVTKGGPKPEPAPAAADAAQGKPGPDGNKAYEKDGGKSGAQVDEKL
ncbi:MAG: nucleotide exchange factor GrpE [Rhodospirillaceae bacterium]